MTWQILRVLLVTAGILLAPLAAMQFTSEVSWTAMDFAVAGVLLAASGLILELGIRNLRGRGPRLACTVALAGAFLLAWAQLAVGIF